MNILYYCPIDYPQRVQITYKDGDTHEYVPRNVPDDNPENLPLGYPELFLFHKYGLGKVRIFVDNESFVYTYRDGVMEVLSGWIDLAGYEDTGGWHSDKNW